MIRDREYLLTSISEEIEHALKNSLGLMITRFTIKHPSSSWDNYYVVTIGIRTWLGNSLGSTSYVSASSIDKRKAIVKAYSLVWFNHNKNNKNYKLSDESLRIFEDLRKYCEDIKETMLQTTERLEQ